MMENSAGNFRLSITFVSFVFFFFLIIFVQCLKNMGGCEVPGGSFPVIPLLSLQYDRGMLVQKAWRCSPAPFARPFPTPF